jgi:hypothetical protein
MGLEASSRVTLRDAHGTTRSAVGRVLLESDALVVRGDARCTIPRASIASSEVEGDTLVVRHAGGEARLELGRAAATWAAKLAAAPPSLLDKLGIGPDADVSVLHVHDAGFLASLADRTTRVTHGTVAADSSVVLLGVEHDDELPAIARAAGALRRDAALWVVHPKGRQGVRDTSIFDAARAAGLTATKVARFSETHSAEKLVVPRAGRREAGGGK